MPLCPLLSPQNLKLHFPGSRTALLSMWSLLYIWWYGRLQVSSLSFPWFFPHLFFASRSLLSVLCVLLCGLTNKDHPQILGPLTVWLESIILYCIVLCTRQVDHWIINILWIKRGKRRCVWLGLSCDESERLFEACKLHWPQRGHQTDGILSKLDRISCFKRRVKNWTKD